MKEKILTCRVQGIYFHNEANAYTVMLVESGGNYLTAVGNVPNPYEGAEYRLTGYFDTHPTYGEQFKFTSFEEIMPKDTQAIFEFLSSGLIKGVAAANAVAIVGAFGEDSLRILEEEPERLTEIKGIGKKTATTISESYREHISFASVALEFRKFGLSTGQALKLFKAYGKDALSLVEENPYRLIDEVEGFGFKKADELAAQMGILGDSDFRIDAAIKYTLYYYAKDGSTYVPSEKLEDRVISLIDVGGEKVKEGIVRLSFKGEVKIDQIDETSVIYLYSYYAAERKISSNLLYISQTQPKQLSTEAENMISHAEKISGISFSDQQKYAVKTAVTEPLSIITGGPGTGKTTIINAILAIFDQSGIKTAVAAPTGRAAKRITETSDHEASTIHRLLEYYRDEETGFMVFGKDKKNPLSFDAIIVDEASMIDLMLMYALTESIKPGSRFILIGDSDQLPPVNAGNVLKDMIESGVVPSVKLTEIFRQAEESMIVINAHRINEGEYPYLNKKDKDFYFLDRNSESDMVKLIRDLVSRRLASYYENIRPVQDIQILTPVKRGPIGTLNLNKVLQETLNPPSPDKNEKEHGGLIFREGDKVMQIRNNYDRTWKMRTDFSEGKGIFNGDTGYIHLVDRDNKKITVIFDEDKFVEYEFSQLDELELAYAITVHKSQGSEFPVVVMPISFFPPVLATRNLLYTAITRGKKLVVLLGSRRMLERIIDNNSIKMRFSGLKFRLESLNPEELQDLDVEAGDFFYDFEQEDLFTDQDS
jgi:exodeoxyribonuclease V alpha subunit